MNDFPSPNNTCTHLYMYGGRREETKEGRLKERRRKRGDEREETKRATHVMGTTLPPADSTYLT